VNKFYNNIFIFWDKWQRIEEQNFHKKGEQIL